MFKITRLQIEKFRNVDATELEFADDFVLVLGKNGTGKTTLLNLIAAIASGNYDAIHGPSHIEWSAGGQNIELRSDVDGSRWVLDVAHRDGVRSTEPNSFAVSPHRAQRWAGGGRFDEALEFFDFLTRSSVGDVGLRVPPMTPHWPLAPLHNMTHFGEEPLSWDQTDDPILEELVELFGVREIHASME